MVDCFGDEEDDCCGSEAGEDDLQPEDVAPAYEGYDYACYEPVYLACQRMRLKVAALDDDT